MQSPAPIISVVICTYNNAESLAETLKCITAQEGVLAGTCEILIIDNKSTDSTEGICRQFVKDYDGQSGYYFEGNQGLSHARNLGLSRARGEYILFTDDDATLAENWLAEYMSVIESMHPDCLYSRITVDWDRPKPWWYSQKFASFFVKLDYGDKPLWIQDIQHEFYGKNFAVRKSVLEGIGGFNPLLGRKGDALVAGEETVIYRKLIAAEARVYYFPSALVGHRLKPREYTEENITKAMLDGAQTRFHIVKQFSRFQIFGRPVALPFKAVFEFGQFLVKAIYAMVVGNHSDALFYKLKARQSVRLFGIALRNA